MTDNAQRQPGPSTEQAQLVEAAARLLLQAHHAVALTGAGLSTPSGIPDFRSPTTGLWAQVDPMEVASIWSFRRRPERFFAWLGPLAQALLHARPNPAHLALAQLEASGYLRAVITQNIDSLHQAAGSRRVIELHGHVRTATCTRCYTIHQVDPYLRSCTLEGRVPRCSCGGVLKPDVILMGEDLPHETFQAALEEVRACDVLLVAGTSLEVAPAAELPFVAQRRGAVVIVVNREPTPMDGHATVVLRGDVAWAVPAVVAAMLSPDV
ncbi:MAG: NAD-dependent deacylase [Chloroflexi bacterium]|nr:NAD-dependent deacylase [Chloroflexota bacterium]